MIDGLLQAQEDASRFAHTRDTYHAQLVNECLNTLADALRSHRRPDQMQAALEHATRRLVDLGEV